MTIRVLCECGSRIDAPLELAGQRARCGQCRRILQIPEDDASPIALAAGERGSSERPSRGATRVAERRVMASVFQVSGAAASDSERQAARPRREKSARQKAKPAARESQAELFDIWRRGVLFPLKKESLLTIAVLSMLYGPMSTAAPFMLLSGPFVLRSGLGVMVLTIMIVGYLSYFLFQTLRTTAQNETDLPVAAAYDADEIMIDLWLMLGGTFVHFSPLAVLSLASRFLGVEVPAAVDLALWLGMLSLWPMAVVSAALHTSVLAANLWTVSRAVLKLPLKYGLTLGVMIGLVLLSMGVGYILPQPSDTAGFIATLLLAGFSGFASWFLLFFTMTACMALMGFLYHANRRKLGWFRELDQRY
ncbi:MAG: hypothetical protein KF774_11085 [Planctomyces sp.]|nr:hypothetical protein [Planctomyces sp.]